MFLFTPPALCQNTHKFGFYNPDTLKPQPYKLFFKIKNGLTNTGSTFETFSFADSFAISYLKSPANLDSLLHPVINTYSILDTKTNVYYNVTLNSIPPINFTAGTILNDTIFTVTGGMIKPKTTQHNFYLDGTLGSGYVPVTLANCVRFFWYSKRAAAQIGYGTLDDNTIGDYSINLGSLNLAQGMYTFVAGLSNQANYLYNFSIGRSNISETNTDAFSIGSFNHSTGKQAGSIGNNNSTEDESDINIGNYNRATGTRSFNIGSSNTTLAPETYTLGKGLSTSRTGEIVMGNYNYDISDSTIFSIGAGVSVSQRKNAVTVLNNRTMTGNTKIVLDNKDTVQVKRYRSAVFNIRQTGTGAPILNFIYNELGTITTTYDAAGEYRILGTFDSLKTMVINTTQSFLDGDPPNDLNLISCYLAYTNIIAVKSLKTDLSVPVWFYADDILNQLIEIRVYY
jgi:hypothetical protein